MILIPVARRCVARIGAVNLKDTHLMTRDIADIDYVLLGVFGILRADIENKSLLCERPVY